MAGRAQVRTSVFRAALRRTWTTATSSSTYRDVLLVHYEADGLVGIGEGAPLTRYGETAEGAARAVESVRVLVETADARHFEHLEQAILAQLAGEWAAKSALVGALLDWVGQRLGLPVHALFGLDPAACPPTSYSIGSDSPEVVRAKTQAASAFPVLKVKVGLASDVATIEAVRSVTDRTIRADANEGWVDRELALERIRWLETLGVELIEQPLPAGRLADTRWLRERVEMPIFADEACLRPEDIPGLAGAYDGVNIKLDKAGGILQAHRMLRVARAHGLSVMLGCMVSTSVAITAAAQLAPLADYVDLDGNLLIENDPYRGVQVERGRLLLPTGPGLGLVRAPA